MQLLLVILGLIIGLILLVRGADEMVKSAVHIAQKYKIPQSVVGAGYVGFGTSAPEWVASTVAVLREDLSLAIGNIIGSNRWILDLNVSWSGHQHYQMLSLRLLHL